MKANNRTNRMRKVIAAVALCAVSIAMGASTEMTAADVIAQEGAWREGFKELTRDKPPAGEDKKVTDTCPNCRGLGKVRVVKYCPACMGCGHVRVRCQAGCKPVNQDDFFQCPIYDGRSHVYYMLGNRVCPSCGGRGSVEAVCQKCKGIKGAAVEERCANCHGKGEITVDVSNW